MPWSADRLTVLPITLTKLLLSITLIPEPIDAVEELPAVVTVFPDMVTLDVFSQYIPQLLEITFCVKVVPLYPVLYTTFPEITASSQGSSPTEAQTLMIGVSSKEVT